MTEPFLITPPELRSVLDELIRREPIFHRPEFGTTRADFEHMTAPDFWEVGASGRRYSRQQVLDTLEQRLRYPQLEEWETSNFHCKQLAPDVFLLTYTLVQDHTRKTQRSTIWQNAPGGWKILFHQGTLIQDPAS